MNNGQMNNGGMGGQPKKDYLDKAVDALEKFIGKKTGRRVDPNKYSAQNEKFTDKLRMMFEKATGKKVSAKFSN